MGKTGSDGLGLSMPAVRASLAASTSSVVSTSVTKVLTASRAGPSLYATVSVHLVSRQPIDVGVEALA
jgi:hypothetical protein